MAKIEIPEPVLTVEVESGYNSEHIEVFRAEIKVGHEVLMQRTYIDDPDVTNWDEHAYDEGDAQNKILAELAKRLRVVLGEDD